MIVKDLGAIRRCDFIEREVFSDNISQQQAVVTECRCCLDLTLLAVLNVDEIWHRSIMQAKGIS